MAEAQKTVIVAEPDVLVRMVVSEYLRDCGYKVIEATTAHDVRTILHARHPVDILLSEVSLGGETDGFSLAAGIRQTHPAVDVILTSGIAGAAAESHELCEQGSIKKPYQPKDVEARIRILLERRRASNKP
jgi:DNA-binding response OmpR family regulator